ncbi:hypothetical protein HV453_05340 [Bacillus sporothermodurans]|nr:hypothetical protein [Heyndrickxia sporothermodurans]
MKKDIKKSEPLKCGLTMVLPNYKKDSSSREWLVKYQFVLEPAMEIATIVHSLLVNVSSFVSPKVIIKAFYEVVTH